MKKALALVLAIVLLSAFGTALAEAERPQLSIMTVAAGASFPDGVTIAENRYLDAIEELTGFDLEWSCFNEGSADELRLLLASGSNVPDLLQFGDSTVLTDLALSGALAPLDDALAAYGSDLLAFYPDYAIETGKVEGTQYWLMRYKAEAYVGTMALRKDVLDQLGLSVPTTIEEWEAVYAAVAENTDLVPFIANAGSNRPFTNFAHAMDVAMLDANGYFLVEDGACTLPILSENGYKFIAKMHEWYEKGYMDREFVVRDDQMEQFLAGNGFSMFIDYTQAARDLPTFYETNPDAEVIFVEPPVSPNGLSGVTCGNLTVNTFWFVPASKADKADLAVQFLNACLDEAVINLICYGFEGENWNLVDGVPTFTVLPDDYRGYYSRVVLDGGWDEAWEASMGVYELCRTLATYTNLNEIGSVPNDGCETYFEQSGEINTFICDEMMRLIVEGVDEDSFAAFQQDVMDMGADQCIEEINAWLAESE